MTTRLAAAAVGLAVVLLVALVSGTLVSTSNAQDEGSMQEMDHGETNMGSGSDTAASPATEAYTAANTAMDGAMDIAFTDDADVDFARSMIGHHQGAIDMAQLVHGTDPELRRVSEEIIAAQEAEIDFLENWLAGRNQEPSPLREQPRRPT